MRIAVHAHARRKDRSHHLAAADDTALGDDAVHCLAYAVSGHVVENKLRRRVDRMICAQRPQGIVEIQLRRYGNKIKVRLKIRLQGPHVAPVASLLFFHARITVLGEIIGINVAAIDHLRNGVLAEVIFGRFSLPPDRSSR